MSQSIVGFPVNTLLVLSLRKHFQKTLTTFQKDLILLHELEFRMNGGGVIFRRVI
jgi:hypothetical protein